MPRTPDGAVVISLRVVTQFACTYDAGFGPDRLHTQLRNHMYTP